MPNIDASGLANPGTCIAGARSVGNAARKSFAPDAYNCAFQDVALIMIIPVVIDEVPKTALANFDHFGRHRLPERAAVLP